MERRSKAIIDPEMQAFGFFLQVKFSQVYPFWQLIYVTLNFEWTGCLNTELNFNTELRERKEAGNWVNHMCLYIGIWLFRHLELKFLHIINHTWQALYPLFAFCTRWSRYTSFSVPARPTSASFSSRKPHHSSQTTRALLQLVVTLYCQDNGKIVLVINIWWLLATERNDNFAVFGKKSNKLVYCHKYWPR
jgi:hypothetical protein